MLERISPLLGVMKPGRFGNPAADASPVLIAEMYGRRIIQVTVWPQSVTAAAGALKELTGCAPPDPVGRSAAADGVAVLRVAPRRLWVVSERSFAIEADRFGDDIAAVVELTDSRVILRIEGHHTRGVLAKGLPVDTDPAVMPAGAFCQSVIAHIPVLVSRPRSLDATAFDLYVPTAYARSFWEWLCDAAAEFGYEIA